MTMEANGEDIDLSASSIQIAFAVRPFREVYFIALLLSSHEELLRY